MLVLVLGVFELFPPVPQTPPMTPPSPPSPPEGERPPQNSGACGDPPALPAPHRLHLHRHEHDAFFSLLGKERAQLPPNQAKPTPHVLETPDWVGFPKTSYFSVVSLLPKKTPWCRRSSPPTSAAGSPTRSVPSKNTSLLYFLK